MAVLHSNKTAILKLMRYIFFIKLPSAFALNIYKDNFMNAL